MRAKLLILVAVASMGATAFSPPPLRAALEETVYVTKTGEKYHRGSCQYLRKSKIAIKLSEAKKRYTACSVCKPPR